MDGIRLRDLLRPRDDEDELRLAPADRDRDPERRAEPQVPDALETFAPCLFLHVGHEGDATVLDCLAQGREVLEGSLETRRQRLGRRGGEQLQTMLAQSPEDRRVGTEGRRSLPADRRCRAPDVVGAKARSNPQDPIEPRTGLSLLLVQAGALERLASEARSQFRDLLLHPNAPIRSRRRAGSKPRPALRRPSAVRRSRDARRASAPRRPGSRARTSRGRRPGSSFLRWPPERSAPAWPSGRRNPGSWVEPATRGSTITRSEPSTSPSAAPRAPISEGVLETRACATSDGVTAAERVADSSCIRAMSWNDASTSDAAEAARSLLSRSTTLTQITLSAIANVTAQRVSLEPSNTIVLVRGRAARGPTRRQRP